MKTEFLRGLTDLMGEFGYCGGQGVLIETIGLRSWFAIIFPCLSRSRDKEAKVVVRPRIGFMRGEVHQENWD